MQITEQMRKWRAAGLSYEAIAGKVGKCKKTVQVAFGATADHSYSKKAPHAGISPKSPINLRTLAGFRKEHDQAWKIKDGISRLFKGGVYMTDSEFRDAVGGCSSKWRSAADSAEFSHNRYRVQGELLWASESTIKEMRRIRGEAI